jgi:hypothetical protein
MVKVMFDTQGSDRCYLLPIRHSGELGQTNHHHNTGSHRQGQDTGKQIEEFAPCHDLLLVARPMNRRYGLALNYYS